MEQLIRLVGIARLAAEGEILSEKRRVKYRTLPTRKWLNRCHSRRVPFHWSINPYRGCEFGCKYCYARFTHEFLERRDPDSFEIEIYAKDWNPGAFREELRAVRPGQTIGIGTATDPYQPAERTFKLTRQSLEALAGLRDTSICITTKSNLVTRDADLLAELAKHNKVHVTVTVTTMNRDLARMTEPFAPRPDLRMEAVAELNRAGVAAGVIASPVLPLLTDSEENLEAVGHAAKSAGAHEFGAGVLFLKPSAQRVFFPFLEEHFPEYLKRYEANYRAGAYLKGSYPERIAKVIERVRERAGISRRNLAQIALPRPAGGQLQLF